MYYIGCMISTVYQGGVLAERIRRVKFGVDFLFWMLFYLFLDAFVEGAEGREHREEVAQCTTLETQLFMSAVRLASD